MESEQQIEQIERYLGNQMTAGEKADFETLLQHDPALQRLLQQHSFFLDGVAGTKIEKMAQQFRDQQLPEQKPILRNPLWIVLGLTVLALLIAGIWYFSQPTATEELAREFYAPPLAELQRNADPSSGDDVQQGMLAYNKGDWSGASDAFEKVPKTHASYTQAKYYLGHAYFNNQDFDKAREVFTGIADDDGQYAPLALWNLALTDLLTGHEGEAILILESIAKNPDHFYQKKASELLSGLK